MSSARPPLHFILGDGVIGQAVADELARLGQPLTLASRSGPKGASPHAHTRVVRWTRSSPQHEVGHGTRVRRIEEALAGLPPVAVCGSGFRAVGIPDVASDARDTMRSLLDRWRAG